MRDWWARLGLSGWAAPTLPPTAPRSRGRYNSLRLKAARAAGRDIPGMANIIAERALGLPREPGHDPNVPFSQLPRNS